MNRKITKWELSAEMSSGDRKHVDQKIKKTIIEGAVLPASKPIYSPRSKLSQLRI